jgi:adenylate cyclase class IV
MIEVEQKFLPPAEGLGRLLAGFVLEKTKTNSDRYFDTADYILTAREWWLRERNSKFELKIAKEQKNSGFPTDVFDELETDDEIYTTLGIARTDAGLSRDLEAAGFFPFAHLSTERTTYSDGSMLIDVDHTVSLPTDLAREIPFLYDLVEIEIMVSSEDEILAAQKKIYDFAESRGLTSGYTPGKLLAYIKQCRPEQYEVLRANGIAP